MTCEDLLRMLNDYVDGDIDPGVCAGFDQHLEDCNPCRIVVDTIRKTITLYRNEVVYDMPPTFRDRLHQALQNQWKHGTNA